MDAIATKQQKRQGKSEQELEVQLQKEKSLFENFAKIPIELVFNNDIETASTYYGENNKAKIELNPSSEVVANDRGARALLQHEFGHVLFMSNKAVPDQLIEEYPELKEVIPQIYNILEDYRVEYLWQELFPGSKGNFRELYESSISHFEKLTLGATIENPIDALLIARFGLFGDTAPLEARLSQENKKLYKKFLAELRKLENRDYTSTYVVAKNIISILKEALKQNDAKMVNEIKEVLSKISIINDISNGNGPSNGELRQKLLQVSNSDEEAALSQSEENLTRQLKKLIENTEALIKLKQGLEEGNRSLEEGNRGLDNQEKIGCAGHGVNPNQNVKFYPRYDGAKTQYMGPPIVPVPPIRRLAEEIKYRGLDYDSRSDMYGRYGYRPDIPNMVHWLALGKPPELLRKLYIKKTSEELGVTFYVLVDLSVSMSGSKLDIEKNTLATIYDSLIGSDTVKMRMFGFYNDTNNIVFEFDRKELLDLSAQGGTPTDIALNYLAEVIKRSADQNDKVLILITDGEPNDKEGTKEVVNKITDTLKLPLFTILIASDPIDKEIFAKSMEVYRIPSIREAKMILESIVARGLNAKLKELMRKY